MNVMTLQQDCPFGISFRVNPEKEIVVKPALLSEQTTIRFNGRHDDAVVHIPPAAYLKSLVAIAWGAFRHPFSTTYVDLSTGESVHVAPDSEGR
jgi:hypothetical protein